MKNKGSNDSYSVVDFFCGAGGFSEGFRLAGIQVERGYDNWQPAIDTYNFNFNNKGMLKDINIFWDSLSEINSIPDTDFIIGSPPCVSFSLSNKSGKGQKEKGIHLILSYLRIVAVKKHQKNSKLISWFMENVSNSKSSLKDFYTFKDLNLADWAKEHGLHASDVAINLKGNCHILNASDFGGLQSRTRLIVNESIFNENLKIEEFKNKSTPRRAVKELFKFLPSPLDFESSIPAKDPNYNLTINPKDLSDHFYDTGIYESDWKHARYKKINHPFMGRMSFPEDISKPSRTILATNISISREAVIYKSEYPRVGNGEFRTPTIREAASIMGFNIGYQFIGSEKQKWRLVGNAVCPCLSKALAKSVLNLFNIDLKENPPSKNRLCLQNSTNLNSFILKEFNIPRRKNKNSRFRMHIFKKDNMTVSLTNFHGISDEKRISGKWNSVIQFGLSRNTLTYQISKSQLLDLEKIILQSENGKKFIKKINKLVIKKTPNARKLQELYEAQSHEVKYLNPNMLLEASQCVITDHCELDQRITVNDICFIPKNEIPLVQLYSIYTIGKIAQTANSQS